MTKCVDYFIFIITKLMKRLFWTTHIYLVKIEIFLFVHHHLKIFRLKHFNIWTIWHIYFFSFKSIWSIIPFCSSMVCLGYLCLGTVSVYHPHVYRPGRLASYWGSTATYRIHWSFGQQCCLYQPSAISGGHTWAVWQVSQSTWSCTYMVLLKTAKCEKTYYNLFYSCTCRLFNVNVKAALHVSQVQ